jgi:hypothetical protein
MYDPVKLSDAFIDLTNCYWEKCKKEVDLMKKTKDKYGDVQTILYKKYENGELTFKEFKNKSNKNDAKFYNSITHKKLSQCKLDKCYDLAKQNLDGMLERLNYPIKETYNLKDYIKIIKLNQRLYVLPIYEIKK